MERVYRHIYYRVSNQADAEELTQQTFLQAWQAMGRYRSTGAPFVAWLLTIAHNQVIAFYRRAKNTTYLEMEPAAEEIRGEGDPEASVLAQFDRQAVRRALLRLKPEQQQVIILRFVEGFDYGDIATALGKSEGNIRVIQHRALGELRRHLQHQIQG